MRVPEQLRETWRQDGQWLAELPQVVSDLAQRWNLVLEDPYDVALSLVVPAGDFVLKVNAPSHVEAVHEADALAHWAGSGAVRLVEHDSARGALLIERCRPGTRLWDAGEDELAVTAALLPRLWREPSETHPFELLVDEARSWAADVNDRYERAGAPFERTLLDYAADVFNSADRTARALVNQDLHGGNILRAKRETWLVIDPKPIVGEREANGVAPLRNAAFRGGPARVRDWLNALTDLGLDRERTRGWAVAHALAWGRSADDGWSPEHIAAARAILNA
jgi:streptomycin 6-kinase